MRFIISVLLLILVSCGKSPSSGSPADIQREEEENSNEVIDNVVETDLLDVALDLSVEVSDKKIIFHKSSSQMVEGIRANCSLSVESGEVWDYSVIGKTLQIFKGRQKFNMARAGEGNGIIGSWVSKSYEGPTFVIRRISFISKDRMIMRASCEQ